MSSLADQYENWFKSGNRDLAEFLSNNTFNEEQFRDCVLTDQFLRHQSGEEVDVAEYATQFKRVSKNPALQTELWLEAFGYMEDRGTVSLEFRQQFLARIPNSIRAAVADELLSQSIEATLPTEDPPQIPRYRIENEIGRGTFGIVYQAWDEQLARPVAIKVIQSEQSTESLFAEARLAAGLDAPGIISVYDCGVEAGGRSYLVTSLVEGPDLRKWSDSIDRADRNRICGLFVLLCESLAKAHQNGIVHRDIKPTNIVVKETDEPVLLDFGLAIGNWQAGRQGELIGTPAYMSPEQARGEGHLIDARSDIFSVGILLIETLTGKKPWQNRSSRELLREIAHGNAISVRNLDGQIPVELEHICSKATATNMSERYSSISELAEELKWFCAEKSATSDVDGPSGSQPIGPRGLRPYTHDDAAAFWQLLPGHRNGKGVPDSVRWWLEQLQRSEAKGPPRAVLVLYGPSGSGKSSLLHAGVIPFVNANTRCYSVDASELNATVSLAQQIANYVPGAPSGQESLPASMAVIREAANHRTVIVFDQFEQIFAWSDSARREEVLLALRQADGERLQFVLVVRDEFWSAISQWMRELDTPLRDGRNAMALERFSRRHAAEILRTWTRSLGNWTNSDDVAKFDFSKEFVEQALDLVIDDDRVVPVRLALLASILGQHDWTLDRLKRIALQGSLSGFYLDTVLGELAPAARRRYSRPAKEILRSLTPVTGRIRGASRSVDELRAVSEPISDSAFADLLDLLDRQLHLVTPVEGESSDGLSGKIDSSSSFYQLPHDFLVPEIRTWLAKSDRRTWRGRASADLRTACDRWKADPRQENLAGPVDCVRFGLVAKPSCVDEREFVRVSARRQLFRSAIAAATAAVLIVVFQFALMKSHGRELTRRLLASKLEELPTVVAETRENVLWTSGPLDSVETNNQPSAAENHQDRVALARLQHDATQAMYLSDRLAAMEPKASRLYAMMMRDDLQPADRTAVVSRLAAVASDESRTAEERLKSAIALGVFDAEHSFWKEVGGEVCSLLVDANPTDLGWLSDGLFPVRQQLSGELRSVLDLQDPVRTRTATFLLAEFAADDPPALIELAEITEIRQFNAVVPSISNASSEIDALLQERYESLFAKWEEVSDELAKLADDPRPRFRPRQGTRPLVDERKIMFARKLGKLGAALILRNRGQVVLPKLRLCDDPSIRSYTIRSYAEGSGPARPLIEMLLADPAQSSKAEPRLAKDLPEDGAAALLQMLGSLPASSNVPSSIRGLALLLYRHCETAELNATAEWYLRKHGYQADLVDAKVSSKVGYQTLEGHTMVQLPGGIEATVGSSKLDRNRLANEERHEIELPQTWYVSRDELSSKQLRRFLASINGEARVPDDIENQKVMRIGFFTAAAYCNWLSEKEGIPKDQWCYLPNEDGEVGPGMTIAADHLKRSGYQIPTPDLWEYACRGGTTTPRHYGHGSELSSPYVRWAGTRSAHHKRFAARLPNGFGLFDMLGNSAEWSIGLLDRSRNGPGPGLEIPARCDFHRRGFIRTTDNLVATRIDQSLNATRPALRIRVALRMAGVLKRLLDVWGRETWLAREICQGRETVFQVSRSVAGLCFSMGQAKRYGKTISSWS